MLYNQSATIAAYFMPPLAKLFEWTRVINISFKVIYLYQVII